MHSWMAVTVVYNGSAVEAWICRLCKCYSQAPPLADAYVPCTAQEPSDAVVVERFLASL